MKLTRLLTTMVTAQQPLPRQGLPSKGLLCVLSMLMVLSACVSNGQRIDRLAEAKGLLREVVEGVRFEHVIYSNPVALYGPVRRRLYVYIDGDGRPWGDSGRVPAADPTTGNPLALRLMLETDVPSIYVSRPCYQDLVNLRCGPALWTSARYSDTVVSSMINAIKHWAEGHGYQDVVLIGYSGGGTLAVLVGERLPNTAAVITLSGNLDIDEWTRFYDYLPLTESLNPAHSFTVHPWPEWHFRGDNDTVVPPQTTENYFTHYPYAQQRTLSGYNHACCWVASWATLFSELRAQLP